MEAFQLNTNSSAFASDNMRIRARFCVGWVLVPPACPVVGAGTALMTLTGTATGKLSPARLPPHAIAAAPRKAGSSWLPQQHQPLLHASPAALESLYIAALLLHVWLLL